MLEKRNQASNNFLVREFKKNAHFHDEDDDQSKEKKRRPRRPNHVTQNQLHSRHLLRFPKNQTASRWTFKDPYWKDK